MNTSDKGIVKNIMPVITISLVALLLALAYQLFVVENNFAPAGLNGIATMIQYKTGFSIGYMSLIINIPLCVFAFFMVDRKFAVYTLVFCLVYSFSFLYFQKLGLTEFQYRANDHNTIYPVLLSGLVAGFVYGMCFWNNACTGGTDIVSKYVSKVNASINFFWITFIINAIVAISSFFVYAKPDINGQLVYDYQPVCLSLIYSFLSSFIGNTIIKGTKSAVKFTIITEHPEEISNDISKEIKHSSTQIKAIGSFSRDNTTILICVINKHQMIDLQDILNRYDHTFSFSESVNETYGNFKKIKQKMG